MKFLVDAQLPRRIAQWLRTAGFDAIHTLDLPEANRTADQAILRIAKDEQRVVITKDADFVDSFLLAHRPEKLLLISTGNITNSDLEKLLIPSINAIVDTLRNSDFVELTRIALIIHI
jgi:predicted nuclease of predicted toxin-antitoxin system